ncbi:MAG: topology modulation protein [Bacteroidota bacterium]
MKHQRIMVAGCSGSGKSTFSRELAARTKLPLIHLDREYWLPGWVEPSKQDWRRSMAELVQQERWIMDGNYSATWDIRLPRTELVIYLQYPLWLLFWRSTKRILSYRGRVRPDMAPGCPEHFNWSFYHFLIGCWYGRKRHHLAGLADLPDTTEVLIFRSPQEARRWLLETHPSPPCEGGN